MNQTYRTKKRSDRIIPTKEGRLIKQIRIERKFSMRRAAALVGLSDSYIAHIETGRMDFPTGKRLQRVLSAYGVRTNTFYERLRDFEEAHTAKDELLELVHRMREKELETLLVIAKGIIS